MILFFDTETTGMLDRHGDPLGANQPHLVQYAGILMDPNRKIIRTTSAIIKPCGWTIPEDASKIHGITQEMAMAWGVPSILINDWHLQAVRQAKLLVGHNIDGFDLPIMDVSMHRDMMLDLYADKVKEREIYDTMLEGIPICKIPPTQSWHKEYKWPKLTELHQHLFHEDFPAHDALDDVRATARCYFKMLDDAQDQKDPDAKQEGRRIVCPACKKIVMAEKINRPMSPGTYFYHCPGCNATIHRDEVEAGDHDVMAEVQS